MSRRDYPPSERYVDRESDVYRRPRRDRDYDDVEVDISRSRTADFRRPETLVRERDRETVVSDRRGDRGPRQPDFLREDYGRSTNAGPLVVREEREEDVYRAPTRRRSIESVRSRAPAERVEREEIIIKDRERDRGLPYPSSGRSEVDFKEREAEEIIYRDRARSRAPPPREERSEEKIDISIRRDERDRSRPPPPRSEVRERDVEEVRFRRGGGDRPGPSRTVEREEIDIRERRSPLPRPVVNEENINIDIDIHEGDRTSRRDREVVKEEIDIRETSRSSPRPRSRSRGALVARKEEEWIVRRPRTPPPRDYEKEEIIIRRKERTPSPEPVREPTPEPIIPQLEPVYRPPIIQEVITHHRHIDHGFERARSPTPPPPPPSPPREDNLEIEIRRKGVRNGKAFDENLVIEQESRERDAPEREVTRRQSLEIDTRRRSPSRRRHYDDEVSAEADYYNRRIASRAYPGEAYNGATRDWGLVDIPPGTERVRMDGIGGGAQEIHWQRYNGERKGRFISNDRAFEEFSNGHTPPPLSPHGRGRDEREFKEEIKITESRTTERDRPRRRERDKMWTEVTKDLVIKEAIEEQGYEYEETDGHFYIIEYLKYEDVVRLVEITEEIKRERRERIREIQWEREESERIPKMLPAPPRSAYDERIYEREFIVDRDGRRYR